VFRDSLGLVRGPRRRGGGENFSRVQNDAIVERRRFVTMRIVERRPSCRSSSRLSSRSFALLIRRR